MVLTHCITILLMIATAKCGNITAKDYTVFAKQGTNLNLIWLLKTSAEETGYSISIYDSKSTLLANGSNTKINLLVATTAAGNLSIIQPDNTTFSLIVHNAVFSDIEYYNAKIDFKKDSATVSTKSQTIYGTVFTGPKFENIPAQSLNFPAGASPKIEVKVNLRPQKNFATHCKFSRKTKNTRKNEVIDSFVHVCEISNLTFADCGQTLTYQVDTDFSISIKGETRIMITSPPALDSSKIVVSCNLKDKKQIKVEWQRIPNGLCRVEYLVQFAKKDNTLSDSANTIGNSGDVIKSFATEDAKKAIAKIRVRAEINGQSGQWSQWKSVIHSAATMSRISVASMMLMLVGMFAFLV